MRYAKLFAFPLVVNPAFVAICGGDGTCGIMLDYLYSSCLDGPTPISYRELNESIYLSKSALNRARGLLARAGYISESKGGHTPPTIHYSVNYDLVDAEIDKYQSEPSYQHKPLHTGESE